MTQIIFKLLTFNILKWEYSCNLFANIALVVYYPLMARPLIICNINYKFKC